MSIVRRRAGALLAAAAVALVGAARADTLLDTGTPESGFFGYYGFDVFVGQSVAVAFTPTQDYTLDSVSLWLMSNDFNQAGRTLRVSLQADGGSSATIDGPSGTALESWNHATSAVGWQPVLETLGSSAHTLMTAGTTYWIVAESSEPAGVDPVWVVAGNGRPYLMGNIDFNSSPNWQLGQTSAPTGALVSASPVPEPAVLALALMGLPAVALAARRRRRA